MAVQAQADARKSGAGRSLGRYPRPMSCPTIQWEKLTQAEVYFAKLSGRGGAFGTIGPCAGAFDGQWAIRLIRQNRGELFARAGSIDQAKRFVERWTARHWGAV